TDCGVLHDTTTSRAASAPNCRCTPCTSGAPACPGWDQRMTPGFADAGGDSSVAPAAPAPAAPNRARRLTLGVSLMRPCLCMAVELRVPGQANFGETVASSRPTAVASSQYTARGSGVTVSPRTVTPTTVSPRLATAKPGPVYASSPIPGSGCWRRPVRIANWAGRPRITITISAIRPSVVWNCAAPTGIGPAAAPPRAVPGTPRARPTL